MSNSNRLLVTAKTAARNAGGLIMSYYCQDKPVFQKSNPRDLVTEIDGNAESIIKSVFYKEFPDIGMFGEEDGNVLLPETESLWIVDPLDGTSNYVQNLPFFAVSIALAVKGVIELAVVYDPVRDEMFTALKGSGAWLNDKPIRTDTADCLSDAIISTRTPYNFVSGKVENIEAYAACASRCRSMRNLGAAALELAWVASGRLSAYWERELNLWDWSAGALLVAEAGGKVTDLLGCALPVTPDKKAILASNMYIHDELLMIATTQS